MYECWSGTKTTVRTERCSSIGVAFVGFYLDLRTFVDVGVDLQLSGSYVDLLAGRDHLPVVDHYSYCCRFSVWKCSFHRQSPRSVTYLSYRSSSVSVTLDGWR